MDAMTQEKTGFNPLKCFAVLDAESPLSTVQKIVYLTLVKHADERGVCWPSRALIEKESGVSHGGVNAALLALIECGMVTRQRRGNRSTLYVLSMPGGHSVTGQEMTSHSVTGQEMTSIGHHVTTHRSPRDHELPKNYPRTIQPSAGMEKSIESDTVSKYPDAFERYRTMWRKKGGRLSDTVRAFDAACDDVGVDRVMGAAEAYVRDTAEDETRYTKSAVAWLSDRACYASRPARKTAAVSDKSEGGLSKWVCMAAHDGADTLITRRIYWDDAYPDNAAAVAALDAWWSARDTPGVA